MGVGRVRPTEGVKSERSEGSHLSEGGQQLVGVNIGRCWWRPCIFLVQEGVFSF